MSENIRKNQLLPKPTWSKEDQIPTNGSTMMMGPSTGPNNSNKFKGKFYNSGKQARAPFKRLSKAEELQERKWLK